MVVPLVADRVAEAEREDDAQELHGDHSDDDPDDDVQAADQVVVNSLVAALRDTISKQMRGILEIGFQDKKLSLAHSLTHPVHVRVGRARRVDAVVVRGLEERRLALQLAARLRGE